MAEKRAMTCVQRLLQAALRSIESGSEASGSSRAGVGTARVGVCAVAVTYAVNQMVDIDYRPLAEQANAQALVSGCPSTHLGH
jgi:hypothetical protein